ncbi:hypothetical protein [Massilia sp. CF038]|uniref:hypothetical protein n=1 Tax=Massilia sp. CF038 TaxID=1881045 RepID=UPI000920955F|nr:hypothetical protein [Massilia sp. CF038]SHH20804.1 hypothetical protein SAMN05428948_3317 [Massilia sp. CF038]
MSAGQFTLSAASDLTQYAVQADILDAEHQFEAVHSRAGGALLFFIGSGEALCVAKEESGREHGWARSDLSSGQTRRDFPWGASCKQFAAVQGESGAIDLAMVLSDGSDDHLYLSLGNSDADTSWTDAPGWLPCPYNAEDSAAPEPLHIARVFISDASDRYEIAIDIIANPGARELVLRRYYLDLSTPSHPTWIAHASAAAPLLDGFASVLGRADCSEGVYTLSGGNGLRRLQYSSLHGAGGQVTPAPVALRLPGDQVPEAIAACRNVDNSTDLYVAAQGGLYMFAAGSPREAQAVHLAQAPLFEQVRSLRALRAGERVVVWGLRADGSLFYLSCAQGQAADPGAWSKPLCMLAGVSAFSPFYDRLHGALVLLARGADGLLKSVKSPVTGLWNRRRIMLPPSNLLQQACSSSAYVTCIRVSDENGMPVPHAAVQLSASSVTSVHINGLYRMVGPVALSVLTDAHGALHIVDHVSGLAGARFEVRAGACSLMVNPMEQAFQTAAGMADDASLGKAYLALGSQNAARAKPGTAAPAAFPHAVHGDVGDLFSWLECGTATHARIVHDSATGLWHLLATIGGQLFHGVLDCIEKIVAATLWVIGSVKGSVAEPGGLQAVPVAALRRAAL